ncbi:MAG TPA: tripartite tricarboxylate transporter substrate binding protein [Casimicrobiaceae bacterium]|nr:tripartite tricarboxylate transporter substrate binding protein [Casimicrobiaceae bacterium]
MRIFHSLSCALAALCFAVPADVAAQTAYPTRPVRIIVPYPAGGVADALPRIVGEKLAERLKQPVVVENRPGASGNIGMEQGARAEPDGYTLVLAPAGNLTVNPILFPKLSFDTAKDFVPIINLASSPNVLVVHPSVPAKTLQELVAYAKANPGKLNFASPGDGSGAHLAGELLNLEASIQSVHVPYKGLAPAVNDLLGGQVQMMFAGISTVLPHIKSGKLVPLAIASPRRSAELPDVPTVAERGYPDFDVTSWYGLVVRSGTPSDVVQKLSREIAAVLSLPDVRDKLAVLGLEPVGGAQDAFASMIASETTKWRDIVRRAGIKPLQ